MMRMKTPSEISRLLENKAARITVQRITVVINRRRNTRAFEGVWATTGVSDMRPENSKGDRNCQHRLQSRVRVPPDGTEFSIGRLDSSGRILRACCPKGTERGCPAAAARIAGPGRADVSSGVWICLSQRREPAGRQSSRGFAPTSQRSQEVEEWWRCRSAPGLLNGCARRSFWRSYLRLTWMGS